MFQKAVKRYSIENGLASSLTVSLGEELQESEMNDDRRHRTGISFHADDSVSVPS